MTGGQRIGCVLFSLVFVIPVSVISGTLLGEIPARDPVPADAGQAALRREEAIAVSLGLTPAGGHPQPVPTTGEMAPASIALSEGECVAIIVAAWGQQQVRSASIANDRGVVLAVDRPTQALAAQAQWCTDRAGTFTLTPELTNRDLYARAVDGFAQAKIHRGSGAAFGGLTGLRRGTITLEGARSVNAASLLEQANRLAPAGLTQAQPDIPIPGDAAILMPEDPAAYRVLHTHAKNDSSDNVSPRVAPLPVAAPQAWRPRAAVGQPTLLSALRAGVTTEPAIGPHFPFMADSGARRVLGVIDANRLGGRCNELRFVRMAFGYEAHVRFHPASGDASELSPRQNVASHRLCVGQGAVTYSVPADDQERYLLRVYPVP